MLAVELSHIADMLDAESKLGSVSKQIRQYADVIRKAILEHTKTSNGIFAYETNGLGGQYIMDDANVPSLVSLPYLGFLPRNDSTYQKTKEAMFSRANPYYAVGKAFTGIGYVYYLILCFNCFFFKLFAPRPTRITHDSLTRRTPA